jgi:hypothetical protein
MAELFDDIWVNQEPRWPRLARLVGGSFVLHSAIVAAILFVPTVRTAFNLAGTFSGVAYKDEAYERTKIEDRAIMLSLKDGKFTYPPGYFGDVEAPVTGFEPPKGPEAKIISEYKPEKEPPKPKPSPTPKPLVSPTPKVDEGLAKAQEIAKDLAEKGGTKEEADTALNQIAESSKVERPNEAMINKRPLKDWLAYADEMRTSGKLDLDKPVEIVITADREPTGRLTNVQIIRKEGDPALIDVATRLASAISDSNVLYFLKDTTKLRLTMRLDDTQIMAKVESDVGSESNAKQLATAYAGFLSVGQYFKKGLDEEAIYKAAQVKSEGKQVVVNFAMTRDAATDILKKQVAKQPAS